MTARLARAQCVREVLFAVASSRAAIATATAAMLLVVLRAACADAASVRLAFGQNYPPYDRLTSHHHVPTGSPIPADAEGFGIEFAREACATCSLDCHLVAESYNELWSFENRIGSAIASGAVDAGSMFTHTYDRAERGVRFSDAITRSRPAGILTRLTADGNPVVRASSDLTHHKIGLVRGWATSAASLIRMTNSCTREAFSANAWTVEPVDMGFGPDAAVRALLRGEVDALFMYSSTLSDRRDCDGPACDASLYDASLLGSRYAWIHTGLVEYAANGTTLAFGSDEDSTAIELLNPCIQATMASPAYARLCAKYRDLGFESIKCFGDGDSSSPEEMPNAHRIAAGFDDCQKGYCGCGGMARSS